MIKILLICTFISLVIDIALISERPFKDRYVVRMDCSGNVSFFKDGMVMRTTTKIKLSDNQGVMYLTGSVYKDNQQVAILNRAVYFTSSNTEYRYTWISNDIKPSMEEELPQNLAERWLPRFFLYKNEKRNYIIKRVNLESYLISGELIPYFICSKSG